MPIKALALVFSFAILVGCGSESTIQDPPSNTATGTTGGETGNTTGGSTTGNTTTGGGTCEPSCSGKDCGPDSCGGFCGICSPGTACNPQGVCEGTNCKPKCQGKACGPDGCGGFCGVCEGGEGCNGAGVCVGGGDCTPDCENKLCGDDGCGNQCGKCAPGLLCDEELFRCVPTNDACGTVDGVGQCQQDNTVAVTCKGGKLIAIVCDPSKGLECGFNETKNKYDCIKKGCVPDCTGKACGSDGCGGICGQCKPSEICNAQGQCQLDDICVPACSGKVCGPDGCGGQCGLCDSEEVCTNGDCIDPNACTPTCDGKSCGSDGCGGTCGTCKSDESCTAGKCVTSTCVPNCAGKQCGTDGCGGDCGKCPENQTCDAQGHCVTLGDCGTLTYEGTCNGDTVQWCEGSTVKEQDCKGFGDDYKCAWVESQGSYWCTNKCQATCDGKECGDDGCGGDCGSCPGEETCNNNGLCIAPGGGGECGDISYEGICEGNTLKYCSLGTLQVFSCGSLGKKCGWKPEFNFNACVDSTDGCTPNCLLADGALKECGDDSCGNQCGVCDASKSCDEGTCVDGGASECGDITIGGECNGDTLVYCSGGSLNEVDCAAAGETCGSLDGNWFDCMESDTPPPAGSCGNIKDTGLCLDNVINYCSNGALDTLKCADFDAFCMWSPTANGGQGSYDCLEDPGCIGSCPADQRCQFDGSCGCDGATVEGQCEGQTLVWCNGEKLVINDCAADGDTCGFIGTYAYCQ